MKRQAVQGRHGALARRIVALVVAALLSGGCVLTPKADKAARAVFGQAEGAPVELPAEWEWAHAAPAEGGEE